MWRVKKKRAYDTVEAICKMDQSYFIVDSSNLKQCWAVGREQDQFVTYFAEGLECQEILKRYAKKLYVICGEDRVLWGYFTPTEEGKDIQKLVIDKIESQLCTRVECFHYSYGEEVIQNCYRVHWVVVEKEWWQEVIDYTESIGVARVYMIPYQMTLYKLLSRIRENNHFLDRNLGVVVAEKRIVNVGIVDSLGCRVTGEKKGIKSLEKHIATYLSCSVEQARGALSGNHLDIEHFEERFHEGVASFIEEVVTLYQRSIVLKKGLEGEEAIVNQVLHMSEEGYVNICGRLLEQQNTVYDITSLAGMHEWKFQGYGGVVPWRVKVLLYSLACKSVNFPLEIMKEERFKRKRVEKKRDTFKWVRGLVVFLISILIGFFCYKVIALEFKIIDLKKVLEVEELELEEDVKVQGVLEKYSKSLNEGVMPHKILWEIEKAIFPGGVCSKLEITMKGDIVLECRGAELKQIVKMSEDLAPKFDRIHLEKIEYRNNPSQVRCVLRAHGYKGEVEKKKVGTR